jgi:MFS transporter, FSR family, fosmidomycin resistance protein
MTQDARSPLSPPDPVPAPVLAAPVLAAPVTQYAVILAISLSHFINDVMQSLITALYPLLRAEFDLTFSQVGLLSLAVMGTSSVLQPVFGHAIDRRPLAQSLAIGMACTTAGLVFLAQTGVYAGLVAGAVLIGVGSAVFHPEASRVTRAAAGRRFGTAQSLFQVGGNAGQATGPLLAAFIVMPVGRVAIAGFAVVAALGIALLGWVGRWHAAHRRAAALRPAPQVQSALSRRRVGWIVTVLMVLVFSKNVYTSSLTSYYTFFLIDRFDLPTETAQVMLFLYLAATAAGVMLGGLIGDRFGIRMVIWLSILGALPFTLALPYLGVTGTAVVSMLIGFIIASSFPAIVVYAQELLPGRVGLVGGLFFGAAFGLGGIGAAVLGRVADAQGIAFVFQICAFLPALGLLSVFLPRLSPQR